jgi:MarR family 2-MHQ and catechol resistance regulon transcriptional repressor
MSKSETKPDSRSRESDAAALWVVLARAHRAMAGFVEQSVSTLGLGLSEFMILEALLHKGPLTMSALCQSALLANASMTSAIDRLEKKQLVERITPRTAEKQDRRVRLVQLTAEGIALIKRLFARHLRDLDEVMKDIPAADRAELRRGLKTLGLAAQTATATRRLTRPI